MADSKTHEYLVRLLEVILQEREYAKNLDMDGISSIMGDKEELIEYLALVHEIDDKDKELASRIKNENRRNAMLYQSTLGWIRETMEFFGKHTVTSTYSSAAATVPSQINGRLLSGKV